MYQFHLVDPDKIQTGARHPRNNTSGHWWASSPSAAEFGPIDEVTQPEWATELMREYY